MAEKKDNRKFEVTFTAISDAKGEHRLKGEILTAAEVGDVDRQLAIGAIVEIQDAIKPEPPKE